jgi:hypothetical protein
VNDGWGLFTLCCGFESIFQGFERGHGVLVGTGVQNWGLKCTGMTARIPTRYLILCTSRICCMYSEVFSYSCSADVLKRDINSVNGVNQAKLATVVGGPRWYLTISMLALSEWLGQIASPKIVAGAFTASSLARRAS